MAGNDNYIDLVKQAQLGDEECLNRLAELARERLREYVYRLTLDNDLTQDILQESMIEMFKFLDTLEKAERFWPWLRTIAANKIRRHYGQKWRRKTISMSEMEDRRMQKDSQEGVVDLVSQELKQIVFAAMHQLTPRHRHILVLRCYEKMKYSEIAEDMGCSEFAARALFCRAKRALAKQLSRRGLGRGYLLTALVLFGKLTATSEAAAANISVTAATVGVGATASLAVMATSKTAIVSLATAGAIVAGTVAIAPESGKTDAGPQKPKAESLFNTAWQAKESGGIEECWYYYPPNANGAVMMRWKSNVDSKQSYCQWLQNDQANYYKHKNTIYISNYRMWASDLTVWRLPTDSPQLREFLSKVEAKKEKMNYVPSNGDGLLVIVKQSENNNHSQITLRYDVSDEEYFRYDWPAGAKIIDNRDSMHKRGWTYFIVSGAINGKEVSGAGRIPFVYANSRRNYPWVRLKVGDGLKFVDSGAEARVYDGSGKLVVRYEGGSFFKGLGRPWMGLHTIDTIRRDAAEKQVWFETRYTSGEAKAEVVLSCEQAKLVYTIDMKNDVIETITISTNDGRKGELRFSYLQEIDQAGNEFVTPRRKTSGRPQQDQPGILWLVQLAEGQLGHQ